jgi:hypothetical protein
VDAEGEFVLLAGFTTAGSQSEEGEGKKGDSAHEGIKSEDGEECKECHSACEGGIEVEGGAPADELYVT